MVLWDEREVFDFLSRNARLPAVGREPIPDSYRDSYYGEWMNEHSRKGKGPVDL